MRILIIEDEAISALANEAALVDAGHAVLGIADSKASALALADRNRPDIALVDINLADGTTGNDIALQLHGKHGTRPIFLTGNVAMITPEARAIALGLLVKPCTERMLLGALKAAERELALTQLACR